jgi:hypothetical protein
MAKTKKRAAARKKNSKRGKASVMPTRKKVSKRSKASVKPARKTVAKRVPPKKAKSKVRRTSKKATTPKVEAAEAKQVPEVVAKTKLPEVVEERLPAVTVVEVAAETTVIDVIEELDVIDEPAPDLDIFEERKIA